MTPQAAHIVDGFVWTLICAAIVQSTFELDYDDRASLDECAAVPKYISQKLPVKVRLPRPIRQLQSALKLQLHTRIDQSNAIIMNGAERFRTRHGLSMVHCHQLIT